MLAVNDAAGEILSVLLRCNHRRHAVEDIIAKDEVVNECSRGMANDHGPEDARTELMRPKKLGRQRTVLWEQLGNSPKEQCEGTPGE